MPYIPKPFTDCISEVKECRENQRLYPEQRDLAIMGEMDWSEEHVLSGGVIASLMDDEYAQFLRKKQTIATVSGFRCDELSPMLFDFQREIVRWALELGRAAIFADCGLGKTPMQLEWANRVAEHEHCQVLILAPLAVSQQTIREGNKFGIHVRYARSQDDVSGPLTITNYENLAKFDCQSFGGVVLDESSILKNFMGKTKQLIVESFKHCRYKLACTATPAPNDHMEIGNHSDFLDVMPSNEMLSRWFINDSMNFGSYRLKGHAVKDFWRWVATGPSRYRSRRTWDLMTPGLFSRRSRRIKSRLRSILARENRKRYP